MMSSVVTCLPSCSSIDDMVCTRPCELWSFLKPQPKHLLHDWKECSRFLVVSVLSVSEVGLRLICYILPQTFVCVQVDQVTLGETHLLRTMTPARKMQALHRMIRLLTPNTNTSENNHQLVNLLQDSPSESAKNTISEWGVATPA